MVVFESVPPSQLHLSKCVCVSFMLWCVSSDNTIGFTSAQELEENSGLAHKATLFYYCLFPHNPSLSLSSFSFSTIFSTYFLSLILSVSHISSLLLSQAQQLCPKLISPGHRAGTDLPLREFLKWPCGTTLVLESCLSVLQGCWKPETHESETKPEQRTAVLTVNWIGGHICLWTHYWFQKHIIDPSILDE